MSLEKYLLDEEKHKIKNISKAQEVIIARREVIKRTIRGKIIVNNTNGNIRDKKSIKNNSDAYLLFLKKEGLLEKQEDKKIKKEENIGFGESKLYEKEYKSIITDSYFIIKDILSELNGGLSNIDYLEKIITKIVDINSTIINFSGIDRLEYNIIQRNKNLVSNINKLIHILNQSKGDIIDYYSNKANIMNLLRTILNSTKNFIT